MPRNCSACAAPPWWKSCASTASSATRPSWPADHRRSTTCQLSPRLAGQRFVNVSDAAWRPDNPNAGRVVEVSFEATRYQLKVLGTHHVYAGTYRARRLLDNVMAVDMHEAHPLGPVHYQLLLSCLTPSQGHFVYTQFNGPILPARRQNTGQWNRVN